MIMMKSKRIATLLTILVASAFIVGCAETQTEKKAEPAKEVAATTTSKSAVPLS